MYRKGVWNVQSNPVRIPQVEGGKGTGEIRLFLLDSFAPDFVLAIVVLPLHDNLNMRFDRLLSALFAYLGTVSAQSLSGLTFDGRGEVSLVWAFDGKTSGRYDFYLCAGDESTGSYVSGMMHRSATIWFADNDCF